MKESRPKHVRAAHAVRRPARLPLPNTRPDRDSYLAFSYDPRTTAERRKNKAALFDERHWGEARWPLVFVPLALLDAAGRRILVDLLPAFAQREMHVLILGEDAALTDTGLANVHCEEGSEALFHQALAAADVVLLPGEMLHSARVEMLAWRYGAIPVVSATASAHGIADNYDPVLESGAAFLAETNDVWGYHAALVRALETYRLPYDWKGIQRTGFEHAW